MSLHGSLAQLVEPRTLNPLVEGSNPSRPTKMYKASKAKRFWSLFSFGM